MAFCTVKPGVWKMCKMQTLAIEGAKHTVWAEATDAELNRGDGYVRQVTTYIHTPVGDNVWPCI